MPSDKVIFLLLVHKDASQVARLIERLRPNRVLVHADLKMTDAVRLARMLEPGQFVAPRHSVNWGGYSQIAAMLALLAAVERLYEGEDYVAVFLSGQCYPIKPVSEFVDLMSDSATKIKNAVARCDASSSQAKSINRYWVWDSIRGTNLPTRILRRSFHELLSLLPRRKFMHPIFFGSQWISLAACEVRAVFAGVQANRIQPREFKYIMAPDEKFFHTFFGNEMPSAARQIQIQGESDGSIAKLANYHLIHPTLSKWYGIEDLAEIETSEKFFVRKVSRETSESLMNYLDSRLL